MQFSSGFPTLALIYSHRIPDSSKLIAIFSIVSGVLLFVVGIVSIGFYIYSVIDVLDKADQSIIFWYFIFVSIDITLVGAGGYFIWVGYKTYKEKESMWEQQNIH